MSAGFELNRLSTTLLLVQACTLAVLAVVYRQVGWSSEWAVFAPRCAGTLVVGALCVWAVVARKRLVAETFFVLLLNFFYETFGKFAILRQTHSRRNINIRDDAFIFAFSGACT